MTRSAKRSMGATMDVGGWLRKLGLEHYEAAFRENKIDDTALPRLTAEDLKDLGVGFVGDRRMLLDAIAALCAQVSAPTPSLSETPLAIDNAVEGTAERRQVTVMFANLVGSTALSTHMDPEDLREVISTYQKCVAQTVRRFGGFVAKYVPTAPRVSPKDRKGCLCSGRKLFTGWAADCGQLDLYAAVSVEGVAASLRHSIKRQPEMLLAD
jgi:hypothetical protein